MWIIVGRGQSGIVHKPTGDSQDTAAGVRWDRCHSSSQCHHCRTWPRHLWPLQGMWSSISIHNYDFAQEREQWTTPGRTARTIIKTSLTFSLLISLRLYTLPYWSNPLFLIFDTQALWRSGLTTRMSKIKNSGLNQYGAKPFKQQQFESAGVEGVNYCRNSWNGICMCGNTAEVEGCVAWNQEVAQLSIGRCPPDVYGSFVPGPHSGSSIPRFPGLQPPNENSWLLPLPM